MLAARHTLEPKRVKESLLAPWTVVAGTFTDRVSEVQPHPATTAWLDEKLRVALDAHHHHRPIPHTRFVDDGPGQCHPRLGLMHPDPELASGRRVLPVNHHHEPARQLDVGAPATYLTMGRSPGTSVIPSTPLVTTAPHVSA